MNNRWIKSYWIKSVVVITLIALSGQMGATAFAASPTPASSTTPNKSATVSPAANTPTPNKSPTISPTTTSVAVNPSVGSALSIDAKSAILVDAQTGQVLFDQNADEALPPASMVKLMTEYLILESISNKNLKWDETITISEFSSAISTNKTLSGIPKAKGDQYTVKDLFYAVTIYSDNGAAIALAERIAGTEEDFTKKMNETAVKLGLSKGARFINSSGLDRVDLGKYAPASIQGESTFSARDGAMIAYHLLKLYPEILEYTKIPSKPFRPTDKNPMINYNWMLEGNANNINFRKFVYPGMDGLKTGHTDNAGYCFTGTASKDGTRFISVVMGAKTRESSFNETRRIMDYGFNNFERREVVAAKTDVNELPTVTVSKALNKTVPVVTENAITFMVKKGTPADAFKREAIAIEESKLVAPLKQGDVVGALTVSYNNTVQKVNLVAKEDVAKASWIRLFFRSIKNFFAGIFGKLF